MSLRLVWRKTRSKGKRQTERGSFYIQGTDHLGHRINDSLFTSDRSVAKREYADRVAKTREARTHGAKAVMTVADAFQLYCEREKNTNEPWLLAMDKLKWFAGKRLVDLTQADLEQVAKELYPGCAKSTIKRQVHGPFMAAYNACVEHEPPLADARKWKTPKVKKKAVNAPDDAYIAALIDAAKMRGGAMRKGSLKPERDVAAVLFITFTGCRSGEAQQVRLKDVDLDRGYVFLRKTKGKDDNPRQVALAPMLADALRAYIATLPADTPGDSLLFQFKSRFGLPQLVKRTIKRAGLPHHRAHEVGRHAWATRMLHSGASLLDVQVGGGWDDPKMVSQFYGHLSQEHVDKVVAGQKLKPKAIKKGNAA